MLLRSSALVLATCSLLAAADVSAIVPAAGPKPIGPYSPGVDAGDYVYISGQGATQPDGRRPATFDAQVRQTLENIKAVLTAAHLSMRNVVYTQIYLLDITQLEAVDRVYARYFSDAPPARAVLGVAQLPGGTPLEINAVAVRDASQIKAVPIAGRSFPQPFSPGILTQDRLFISAMPVESKDPVQQIDEALDGMKNVVEAAGLKLANVVFVNPYLTGKVPMETMNKAYAKRFEFGNTPGRATIEVTSLPGNAQIEFTGIAVRDVTKRRAIRPKNMPPSPTASPCVFAGDTLYCSAKSGFIPGEHGGIFTPDLALQLRQTMRNLQDNLEEAGLTFDDVISTNVYLDDLADFPAMNRIYAQYFKGVYPARTTVQQLAPVDRKKSQDEKYPEIEQISLVAIKRAR